MGMGTWEPYAEGRTTVGFSTSADNIFHTNPQANMPIAGGTFGDEAVMLSNENIPELKTDADLLTVANASTSEVEINQGCLLDPNDTTSADYYKNEQAIINGNSNIQTAVSVIQPSITDYKWVRVA